MSRMTWFILSLLLLVSAPLGAQTMKQQQQREASQKQVDIRLREVQQKLGGVKIDSAVITDEARNELKRLTEELKTRQEIAGRKLGAMKGADSLNWERLKAEANAAVDDLNRVYDRMVSLKNEARR